ncbi:MAG: hypothetical protein AMJ79_08495 [Phycisphaerae bacterium SM23_30]|nr:MAG: hypothetical protein AMJ79_08495 [Phycisphaerae bacterium SM23_30]
MSKSKHKSDFIILSVLGITALTVIFLLIYRENIPDTSSRQIDYRTTYSTNVEGMKVCYTLLERLDYKVRRSENPFLPDNLNQVDVLFLIDPIVPLLDYELTTLRGWVGDGGILICDESYSTLVCRLFESQAESTGAKSFGRPPHFPPSRPGRNITITELYRDYPLARDVLRVVFKHEEEILNPNDEYASHELGTVEILLRDSRGPRITSRRGGGGRIITLADSFFLANGGIGLADNAVLTVNLVAYARHHSRGKRIAFDEYHFGFGHQETGWTVLVSMLWHTSAGGAVLSLTLAGIFFLVYKGRRFGTRKTFERARRRSKLEYVYSVGATYRAAGAHQLAFRINYQWLKGKAAEMVGLPTTGPSAEIAEKLAQWADMPAKKYKDLFQICDQALTQPKLSGRRVSWLLNKLAQVELEVFHGHQRRR